jgi:ubiquinone/menaquinone biosynthesis C-methylase UbiE
VSFDGLAPHYRWLEFLLAGDKLQRCRTAFLSEQLHPANVLILGEGNGRFLVECQRKLHPSKIVCVDASARMLELARQRVSSKSAAGAIDFVHADALAWQPPEGVFDLIVTHFFLDCFRPQDLRQLLPRLAQAAAPHAHWLLADFQIPQTGWRRWRASLIHRLMYLFFGVVTRLPARCLTVPDPLLAAQGFRLRQRRVSNWGLLRSDWWQRA